MAIMKLLFCTRRQPLTAAVARKLKNLLLLQMSVFLACLILFYLIIIMRIGDGSQTRALSTYILGVGIGWVICIRYHVWRHVG